MTDKEAVKYQRKVLGILSGRIDDFYLAGGTALALFYFHHRLSADLDFFTRRFSMIRIKEITGYINDELGAGVKLVGQVSETGKAGMAVYNVSFGKKISLKVDFVEDFTDLIKKPAPINGINILSLEDIYIRKIFTVSGMARETDATGRAEFKGGRAVSKDFFDLYYLSHTFMPLSKFTDRYCDETIKEGIIHWFRTYDRMDIIEGILELKTDKKIDYKAMERHFAKEIDLLLEGEIGDI